MQERTAMKVHPEDAARRATTRPTEPRPRPLVDEVLRLVWRERQISRAEIACRLDLSRSTVSEIVSTLLRTGLVAEVGTGPSGGGRRPIVLQFQDDACGILGVDMGAAHVAVAHTDLRGHVLAWKDRRHPVRSDPVGTRALVAELCAAALGSSRRRARRLVGIGVAVPSPVDPHHPDRLSELVLPAWQGHHGLEPVGERYKVPLWIDNDANLGALAEGWWGAGRGVQDFAYIKVATGIGSGHVIQGKIYRGATGVAGEIGHLAIDPHGGPCICGLRGCLATFVGQAALLARAREILADGATSILTAQDITIPALEEAALAGDPLALQVVREAAEYLGIAVAGLLNLMNPALVILGGDLAPLGELLLQPLRETVARRTLVSSIAAAEVRTSELNAQAVAVGAATMVLEAALADSRLYPAAARRVEA